MSFKKQMAPRSLKRSGSKWRGAVRTHCFHANTASVVYPRGHDAQKARQFALLTLAQHSQHSPSWCSLYHCQSHKSAAAFLSSFLSGRPVTRGKRKKRLKQIKMIKKNYFSGNIVYTRHVDFSALVFSLSSHRHSYIGLVFSSRFLDS
jgi:hypothetical protein